MKDQNKIYVETFYDDKYREKHIYFSGKGIVPKNINELVKNKDKIIFTSSAKQYGVDYLETILSKEIIIDW